MPPEAKSSAFLQQMPEDLIAAVKAPSPAKNSQNITLPDGAHPSTAGASWWGALPWSQAPSCDRGAPPHFWLREAHRPPSTIVT